MVNTGDFDERPSTEWATPQQRDGDDSSSSGSEHHSESTDASLEGRNARVQSVPPDSDDSESDYSWTQKGDIENAADDFEKSEEEVEVSDDDTFEDELIEEKRYSSKYAGSSRISNLDRYPFKENENQDPSTSYPQDCYTFLSLHGPFAEPVFFWMGMMVVFFQISLICMMLLSVLHPQWGTKHEDNPSSDVNRLAKFIAANSSPVVQATQFLAILSYVLFAEASMLDITTAVETWPVWNKATFRENFGAFFSCALRLFQGTLATLAVFLLIVTSETAVEIVLNFSAVNFISHLDDVAFKMAIWGKYGPKIEKEAKRITTLHLPPTMVQRNKYTRFHCTCGALIFVFGVLLTAIIAVQANKNIWRTQVLRVEFLDADLQAYSGCYHLAMHTPRINAHKRDIYALAEDVTDHAGFRYCIEERRWVLSKNETNACDTEGRENMLAKSAKMNTFDVLTAFEEGGWLGASNSPLELYAIKLDKDQEEKCHWLNDGICNLVFNELKYQYDGGDCCSATCSDPICGFDNLKEAFDVSNITGHGFPHCQDPSMVPVTIHLGHFMESVKKYGYWQEGNPREDPHLMLECDDKVVLSLDINEDMSNGTQSVWVNDRAHCIMRIKNQTYIEHTIWYVSYSIFIGEEVDDKRKIIEGNSIRDGIVSFLAVPSCILDKLSTHADVYEIYNGVYSKQALDWIVDDNTGYSDCRDQFFTERYGLSLLNFEAPISTGTDKLWINTNPTCLWFAMECKEGVPSDLNLSFQNLKGQLSKNLKLLQSLSRLNFASNNLKGSIPSEIQYLQRLTDIDLNSNDFTGPIPSEVGVMTGLSSLDLSFNQLTGNFPSEISNMRSLSVLGLESNKLTGTIPKQIGNMQSLSSLFLSSNEFIGGIPSEIWSLKKLSSLSLNFNNFTEYIPSLIGRLTQLASLSLSFNNLTASIPSEVGVLTRLTSLSLYSNKLTGRIPSEIGGMTSLSYLYLSSNKLTGNIPSQIGKLTRLSHLILGENELIGSIPDEIGALKNLETIELQSNELTGTIPLEICTLKKLKWMKLSLNALTGTIPSEIGVLTDLKFLSLFSNTLSGSIPSQIGAISSLSHLHFGVNELRGSIPSEFGNLTILSSLELDKNQLTATIPSEIGSLVGLSYLYLHWNRLTGGIPSEIGAMTSISHLSMSYNRLSGRIPSEIGMMTGLSKLHLGSNQLSGSIPHEIGACTGLTSLELEFNQLTGSFASQIEGLTSLVSLSLFSNQLTGTIPSEIMALKNLSYLYLHANLLTGEIPSEIWVLENLTHLFLSSNALTGGIPFLLGRLQKLLELDLDTNQLTGYIPSEIGALTSLTNLNLFNNTLLGPIPSEIGSLKNLTTLDLRYNAFTGAIPSELGLLSSACLFLIDGNDFNFMPSEVEELLCVDV
eukprot:CAMPEP_0172387980 /NCGR_PEP_ID=MMETSP1061-20121228/5161_1 /TAXON_ID=37318 /ORGANISM="Pseudo-nitzschia pungens, Strain cf. pungens" /LENGTH=1394 /DNA_ID=CAMNT_0013117749 /DNA_START=764 /DNA_END=4948 /DNA_ORIENTATION=-